MHIKQQFKVEGYGINGIYYAERFDDEPVEIYFKGRIGDNDYCWKINDLKKLVGNLTDIIEAMTALETAEKLTREE